MLDTSNWNLYWNTENGETIRGNLVYSAYISPDGNQYCQRFQRDIRYHPFAEENAQWTEELLEDRFRKELQYHTRASHSMPVLEIVDVDEQNRSIVYNWPGDDFLMQGIHAGSYEAVLPDWKEQWIARIKEMRQANIIKLSLHPNSWTVKDGVLVPMNWFYCYDADIGVDSFTNMNIQISTGRRENLYPILEKYGIDFDTEYLATRLQVIAFNSFRKNYPGDLIDRILEETK
jgi:hypothetical protein